MSSQKSRNSTSFKQLLKQCSEIEINRDNRFLIISSPQPEATLATALLSRAIQRAGLLFHITFVDVLIDNTSIDNIRKEYSDPTTLIVGTEISGKKNLRKGKGYPTLIGGGFEVNQEKVTVVGGPNSIAASAYAFASEIFTVNSGDLQTAIMGALVKDGTNRPLSKTSEELVKLGRKDGLLEERKGVKLFGVNFLPLKQTLLYSTYPFILGVSGDSQSCERILDDADIPLTKRNMPLTSLAEHELPRLSGQLVQVDSKLESSVIQMALGSDYILTHENKKSPVRLLSGIRPLALTAWSRRVLGLTTGVWMGDRSNLMNDLINTQKNHSESVISTVRQMLSLFNNESTDEEFLVQSCPSGTNNEILADVSRVFFEIGLSDKDRIAIYNTDTWTNISWYRNDIHLKSIIRELRKNNLYPISTSAQSVQLSSPFSKVSEIIMKSLTAIKKKAN